MKPPRGLAWRASTTFILITVAVGLFTDLFLYGLVVPVLPFLLQNDLHLPEDKIQPSVSGLLAAYAAASVIFSIPIGILADRTNSRRMPFLLGLAVLIGATALFAFGKNLAVLVVARVLQGTSAAVVWTVGLAMVMDTVGPENLGKVIGTIFSFISSGELLAPVLGGVLYKKKGKLGVFSLAWGILAADFLLRILVVEKRAAAKFNQTSEHGSNTTDARDRGDEETSSESVEPNEEDLLLPKRDEDNKYQISPGSNRIFQTLPILYCFRDPRLPVSLLLACVQASLIGAYDATIPTQAADLFGFDSLSSSLLFIPLVLPYIALGPVAGWAVDRYGTKPAAVGGFTYLVPAMILLRLPEYRFVSGTGNIALYCALISLNGVGLAIIGSPSIVGASEVIQRYHKANPDLFGENGPYAQLYGFNSVAFCAGLTVGPLLSGALRTRIGYGNMNAVFAGISGLTALLSFFYIGGKPSMLLRRKDR